MSELQVNAKDKLEPVARVDPNATTDLPDGGNVSGSNEHILHNAGKIRPPVRLGSSHLLPLGSARGPEASSRSRGEHNSGAQKLTPSDIEEMRHKGVRRLAFYTSRARLHGRPDVAHRWMAKRFCKR